ncbi:MAG: hypothetical protein AMJ90_04030 [candidate division Zixibacteria bacterium SM23_73_2]|nr:MAG: hypothetical protein AMJ90_04030 [candidate division Zixibacteria bacterium SM23_73_2]
MFKIKKVQTKKELLDFIKFPWKIYKDDPNWVPHLISERKEFFDPLKNPFFKHSEVVFFLAKKDKEIVGRIGGHINHNHNDFHNEKTGFFGFFECVNDFEVAKLLLDTVRDWLKSKGMEIMRGPANFSTNEEIAFLLEGFDSAPAFMMSYNPKYYLDLMGKYGMRKAKDVFAWYFDRTFKPSERVIRIAERVEKKENLKIRTLDLKDFGNEIKRVKKIYNSAWSKNWGFVPMNDEEFEHMCKNLKQIVDPQMVFIAEIDGEPVGFSLALPNINPVLKRLNGRFFPFGILKLFWFTRIKNMVKSARIITLGVVDNYRKKGIETIFYVRSIRDGIKRGYTWGELSWVLEDNVLMNKALETLGAKLYKKYRIYEMRI